MAISTRWSPSPVTRPAHTPSTMARPSSSRPSSAKKEIAASRDSTTMPTLSIRLSAMCPFYNMSSVLSTNERPGAGLLQSRSPLCHQRPEGFLKMIGEFAPGMSDIVFALSSEQSEHGVVEHGEHLRGMAHAQLRMIFAHGGITPIMQSVFDPPMSSAQCQDPFGIG